MNCSAKDIVDAIITAGVRRGSDGRGKDGLDGRMFMLARTDRKGFGMLFARALRLKMKAKPEHWAAGKKWLTEDEVKARFRELGMPEELVQFMTAYDLRNLPAEPPETAGPNGTRDLIEAVINAAVRHGGDGHGQDGLVGFMLLLQVTEPKTFNMLTGVAQRWQATSRSDKPNKRKPEEELRAAQVALDAYEAEFGSSEEQIKRIKEDMGPDPYGSAEDDDYPLE